MKYDDASWHYGGDFPKDLPTEAGATHIGMFVSWCLLNGLAGELHIEDFPEGLEKLKNREVTPGKWFCDFCDEKFTDEDLSEKGNEFAMKYYQAKDALYLDDYSDSVANNLETAYHASDSWESYDVLEPIVTKRYREWTTGNG
jgi:hypothetical protein